MAKVLELICTVGNIASQLLKVIQLLSGFPTQFILPLSLSLKSSIWFFFLKWSSATSWCNSSLVPYLFSHFSWSSEYPVLPYCLCSVLLFQEVSRITFWWVGPKITFNQMWNEFGFSILLYVFTLRQSLDLYLNLAKLWNRLHLMNISSLITRNFWILNWLTDSQWSAWDNWGISAIPSAQIYML